MNVQPRNTPIGAVSGVRRLRRSSRSRRQVLDRNLERLEDRIAPAMVSLAAGVLTFTAGDGEANNLAVDVVRDLGTDYVRVHENGQGISLTPSGVGLIADSATTIRPRCRASAP